MWRGAGRGGGALQAGRTTPTGLRELDEGVLLAGCRAGRPGRVDPYRLNHIGAQVFDTNGRVAIALFLIRFRGQIPASDVPAYAERLVAAAEQVTVALGGRAPRLAAGRPSGR